MQESKLAKLLDFRSELFFKLKSKKITYYDYTSYSYQFLTQAKIRHIAKCHDKDGLLQNYFFWMIQIEKKVANERQLIRMGVGSIDVLKANIANFIEKRDLMVKRLIKEADLKIISAYVVFEDTVELETEDGYDLYCSKDVLDKLKISTTRIRNSKNPMYLPFIDIFSSYRY